MRRKRLRFFKIFTLINIFLLLFNIFSYFLLTGPGVFHLEAASLSMFQVVEVESSIQPEPESSQEGPSQYNPPSTEPEPEQEFPIWLDITKVNDQYLSDIHKDGSGIYQLTTQNLTFRGQTNIINAIVFIQLNDQPDIIYTTWSDNGYWQWTTPYSLNIATYEIYTWAISPADPEVTANDRMEFQIVEQILFEIPEEPEVPGEPEPPIPSVEPIEPPKEPELPVIIYPRIVPKEIYLTAEEFYNLSIRVQNENHQLYPKEKLVLRTDLLKIKPQEEREVEIKYVISNSEKEKILETSYEIKITSGISLTQYFQTTFNIKPDKYSVEARLERDDKIFIANDYFFVIAKPLIFGATELDITRQELAKVLAASFLFLLIIFIIFSLLLIREYQRSLKDKHISEKDLMKKDYLDLE